MALTATHTNIIFSVGDTVRVHQKIREGDLSAGKAGKTRTQVFQGTVIAIRGEGDNKMFTVRRLGVGGMGIERIFPLSSPLIEKVEVAAKGYVRRAKLYYLREKPPSETAGLTTRKMRKQQTVKKKKSPVRKLSKSKKK